MAFENKEDWTLEIGAQGRVGVKSWLSLIWRYRDLLLLFVRRDFVSLYKQTILGPIWFILQPLISTFVFTVIFGNIAKISTDGTPQGLFYLSGVVLWNYFAECLTKTSETFTANVNIFGKVYFPRVVVPLSIIISGLIKLGVQLSLFVVIYLYFVFSQEPITPNYHLFLLPVLIVMMGGLGLGIGLILSSLTTKYRDLKFLLQFGVQLMMYASPVVYPLSIVPEEYKIYILLNPVTSIIETFRFGFLGVGEFSWLSLGYSGVFMVVILIFGIKIFNSIEKSFMDTV